MRLGGSRYFISFIDDYNRHTWIYLIEKKSEVFDCFRNLKNLVERETKRKIKCLRLDGGKEYFSGEFNHYLQQMGIRREFNCTYTAEQNNIVERKNRSVVEAARAILEEKSMWYEPWSTSRIGSEKRCRHMSCISEGSRTYDT